MRSRTPCAHEVLFRLDDNYDKLLRFRIEAKPLNGTAKQRKGTVFQKAYTIRAAVAIAECAHVAGAGACSRRGFHFLLHKTGER
ncbi:hypothetical protein EVAR_80117_1 [Eumeta japonica]|uniref:Uncharacterized protein n=1 Tax=Eumeta variegata TaxID=151549 RepID=A0A4C1UEA5_EUMVA|nr:hypothetical protein EVAR_80117_1 [Eumeta japonica]